MSGNKLFENVSCQGRIGKGHQISSLFQEYFFSAELVISNLSNKNDSRGSGGMLSRKKFENLHTIMAVLVLFEQISSKISSYFWPLTLSASSNMMHFVRTVSNMRA